MDIRKIALYLSGKLPPYYGNSKRLVFIRQLRTIAPAQYTNEEISFIDQQTRNDDEKFFIEILEDQKQSSTEIFNQIIEGLGLPDGVLDLKKEIEVVDNDVDWRGDYTWEDFKQKIKDEYGDESSNIQKGELFGKLCCDILEKIGGFVNVHVVGPGADEGIDLTGSNVIWLGNSTQISFGGFGQCKYKEGKNVQGDEVDRIIRTISNDSIRLYQMVYFFTNTSYAPKAREALESINQNSLNRKCFWFDGDQILDIINSNKSIYNKYLPNKRP